MKSLPSDTRMISLAAAGAFLVIGVDHYFDREMAAIIALFAAGFFFAFWVGMVFEDYGGGAE